MLIVVGAVLVIGGVFAADVEQRRRRDLRRRRQPDGAVPARARAGVAILFGLSVTKFGAKRELRQRKEQKKIDELLGEARPRRGRAATATSTTTPTAALTPPRPGPARASAVRSPCWPSHRGPATLDGDDDVAPLDDAAGERRAVGGGDAAGGRARVGPVGQRPRPGQRRQVGGRLGGAVADDHGRDHAQGSARGGAAPRRTTAPAPSPHHARRAPRRSRRLLGQRHRLGVHGHRGQERRRARPGRRPRRAPRP